MLIISIMPIKNIFVVKRNDFVYYTNYNILGFFHSYFIPEHCRSYQVNFY